MLNRNPVSVDELRSNLSDILNRVTYANDRIVVKRHNREVAMIISLDEYEKLMDPTKRLSKSEWEEHVKRLDTLRAKMPKFDPEEMEQSIDEGIKDVRVEKRVKGE